MTSTMPVMRRDPLPEGVTRPGQATASAAERLWREMHERLTAFVARRVDEPADVADIVQTVFLRVHQHVGAVAGEERVLPWLFQVTRNAIADHYRSPARRREVMLDSEPPRADDDDVAARALPAAADHVMLTDGDDADAPLSELAACVRPMLAELPAAYREALTRVELEGQSQVDAASALGISVSGMKSRVQRGRSRLLDVLLACCEVSRSATGGVLDVTRRGRSDACGSCGD